MTTTLTVAACRRPLYTSLVLSNLAKCDGIEEYDVLVSIDSPEGSDDAKAVFRGVAPFLVDHPRWRVRFTDRVGCAAAIIGCMNWGFERSDFHINLEDDTLPHGDFLLFMQWASRAFRDDPSIFSATGYARRLHGVKSAYARRWFVAWGWGTWRDRWEEALPQLHGHAGWDVRLNEISGQRHEVAPCVGRIQNIGEHAGTHNSPDLWLNEQWNPVWMGSMARHCPFDNFHYLGVQTDT